jgi:hypothetical protein
MMNFPISANPCLSYSENCTLALRQERDGLITASERTLIIQDALKQDRVRRGLPALPTKAGRKASYNQWSGRAW